jgi:hypothetical protein
VRRSGQGDRARGGHEGGEQEGKKKAASHWIDGELGLSGVWSCSVLHCEAGLCYIEVPTAEEFRNKRAEFNVGTLLYLLKGVPVIQSFLLAPT